MKKFNYRKLCPYIPIIGIFLTFKYHDIYGDTGIEDNLINMITAILQAISIFGLGYFIFALL